MKVQLSYDVSIASGSLMAPGKPVFKASREPAPTGDKSARLGNEVGSRHFKPHGQLFEQQDRRISNPSLEVRDVRAMNARFERELLLRPTTLRPQSFEVRAKALTDIHIATRRDCRRSIYRRSVTMVLTSGPH